MSRYAAGLRQMGAPWIATVPSDGLSSPASMCRIVDLPAPFGPSNPVTPAPRMNEMSLTATTLPYQRETAQELDGRARRELAPARSPDRGAGRAGSPARRNVAGLHALIVR